MSSEGSVASSSSRIQQFGLYRTIDAKTDEFLRSSRKRQITQGCACAVISTALTVTVVVSVILVYEYTINIGTDDARKLTMRPSWLGIMNHSNSSLCDSKYMKSINLDKTTLKLLPILLKALNKSRYLDKLLEGYSSTSPPLQKVDNPENYVKRNIFSDVKNWLKLPSQKMYDYKTTPLNIKRPSKHSEYLSRIIKIKNYERMLNYFDKMINDKVTFSKPDILKEINYEYTENPLKITTKPKRVNATKRIKHKSNHVKTKHRQPKIIYSKNTSKEHGKKCPCPNDMGYLLNKLIQILHGIVPKPTNTLSPCASKFTPRMRYKLVSELLTEVATHSTISTSSILRAIITKESSPTQTYKTLQISTEIQSELTPITLKTEEITEKITTEQNLDKIKQTESMTFKNQAEELKDKFIKNNTESKIHPELRATKIQEESIAIKIQREPIVRKIQKEPKMQSDPIDINIQREGIVTKVQSEPIAAKIQSGIVATTIQAKPIDITTQKEQISSKINTKSTATKFEAETIAKITTIPTTIEIETEPTINLIEIESKLVAIQTEPVRDKITTEPTKAQTTYSTESINKNAVLGHQDAKIEDTTEFPLVYMSQYITNKINKSNLYSRKLNHNHFASSEKSVTSANEYAYVKYTTNPSPRTSKADKNPMQMYDIYDIWPSYTEKSTTGTTNTTNTTTTEKLTTTTQLIMPVNFHNMEEASLSNEHFLDTVAKLPQYKHPIVPVFKDDDYDNYDIPPTNTKLEFDDFYAPSFSILKHKVIDKLENNNMFNNMRKVVYNTKLSNYHPVIKNRDMSLNNMKKMTDLVYRHKKVIDENHPGYLENTETKNENIVESSTLISNDNKKNKISGLLKSIINSKLVTLVPTNTEDKQYQLTFGSYQGRNTENQDEYQKEWLKPSKNTEIIVSHNAINKINNMDDSSTSQCDTDKITQKSVEKVVSVCRKSFLPTPTTKPIHSERNNKWKPEEPNDYDSLNFANNFDMPNI